MRLLEKRDGRVSKFVMRLFNSNIHAFALTAPHRYI
jgi:hypothetical protein